MDIPVPADVANGPEETKIPVATSAAEPKSTASTETTADVKSSPEKDMSLSKEDQDRKLIADLISSKKYYLGIKEKRSSPLLIIGSTTKKSKKQKKKSSKKSDQKNTKKHSGNKTAIQLVVLLCIVVGIVLAIDAEYISVGFTLPFDVIKK